MPELMNNHRRGIIAMVGATLFFSGMDTAMKLLADHYPSLQVVFIRALSSLPMLLLAAPFFGGYRRFKTKRFSAHLLRGSLGVVMLTLVVYSLTQLSLANAYAIFFTGPLFIAMLSIPMLGEVVGRHRWAAIAIGFIGVLVIANPQGPGLIQWGALAALVAAFLYAIIALTMRKLSDTESELAISFHFALVLAVGSGVLSLANWQAIDWSHWPLFILVGATGTIGMMLLATAFRSAQASIIAPFEYTAMIWAIVIDYLIWREIPELRLYVGGTIIAASGIYILHREHRQRRLSKKQESID